MRNPRNVRVCANTRGHAAHWRSACVLLVKFRVVCVYVVQLRVSQEREREATNVGDIGIKLMCSLCSYSHGWFFVRNEFGFEFRKTCCVHRPLALACSLALEFVCVSVCVLVLLF